jgi:hypothetical protein
MMSIGDLVVVKTFNDGFAADVAKSALDAAGIECMVRSDDSRRTQPGLWPGRGVELLVRAEDASQAAEILNTPARPA